MRLEGLVERANALRLGRPEIRSVVFAPVRLLSALFLCWLTIQDDHFTAATRCDALDVTFVTIGRAESCFSRSGLYAFVELSRQLILVTQDGTQFPNGKFGDDNAGGSFRRR